MHLRFFHFAALFALFFACKNTTQAPPDLRLPGEFEPQAAVWLLVPKLDHVEELSNLAVTADILKNLLPHVKVRLAAASDSLLEATRKLLPKEILDNPQFELRSIPYNEFWVRDIGPTFVVRGGKMAVADFRFNAWGTLDTLDASVKTDEKFDELAAAALRLPFISTSLITEGGDHESNGKGTLMLVETVEMGRNPGMDKAQIEAEYRRVTGATNFIWLKKGVREDDHSHLGPIEAAGGVKAYTVLTTNGHVDEFARFADAGTILLAQVDAADLADDPISVENHRRLEENLRILAAATDQEGKPFRIVRMPMPQTILGKMQPGDPVYDILSRLDFPKGMPFPEGREIDVVAAASYCNFLISNGIVIGQKYWKEGLGPEIRERDEAAKRVLQQVFPGRKIVLLDALSVNWGGGGIHCITMQEPAH